MKINKNNFFELANIKHQNKFDYSISIFINSKKSIDFICPQHGKVSMIPNIHLKSNTGCPKCARIEQGKTNSINFEEFISRSNKIHNSYYDYSKIIEYNNLSSIINIICPKHGEFYQKASYHILGSGCTKCDYEYRAERAKKRKGILRYNTRAFITKANNIHSNFYNYTKSEWSSKKHIIIICPIHGEFEQCKVSHLSGHGCSRCKADAIGNNRRLNLNEFINRSNIIHTNKYDYSKTIYSGSHKKLLIECPHHGEFHIIAYYHLTGGGCPKCFHKKQHAWLDYLNIPENFREKRLYFKDGKYIIPDAYDPITKTIYEFWGTYHHGHPDYTRSDKIHISGYTMQECYDRTLHKINKIKEEGYNIIQMWEFEWDKLLKDQIDGR
jgi:hypothetical protein